jgi:D-arabinose 1-dehydrogenase-like Zn-dependent alcohol dehydrogenase
MSDNIKRIAVLGLGRVGSLAATLLHETGFEVVGYDARKLRRKLPFKVEQKSAATKTEALKVCKGFDAVLSCLPYLSVSPKRRTSSACTISTSPRTCRPQRPSVSWPRHRKA